MIGVAAHAVLETERIAAARQAVGEFPHDAFAVSFPAYTPAYRAKQRLLAVIAADREAVPCWRWVHRSNGWTGWLYSWVFCAPMPEVAEIARRLSMPRYRWEQRR